MLDGLSIHSASNRYFTLQVQIVKLSVEASQVFPLYVASIGFKDLLYFWYRLGECDHCYIQLTQLCVIRTLKLIMNHVLVAFAKPVYGSAGLCVA